ncbi:MAG TPA: hypothetical protein VMZ06_13495 [Candidatus Bathyarchaeia archaeon]|nr:hypothetical protein [Candidatus Bathyarchaeia archaeon]
MRWILSIACLIALTWAAAAQVIEVPLTYMKLPTEWDRFYPTGGSNWVLTEKPQRLPLTLPDLPKYSFQYSMFKVGETFFDVVLARSIRGNQCNYSLYVDTNGNGSVADEIPVTATTEIKSSFISKGFPSVDLRYPWAGKTYPFSVVFRVFQDAPTIGNMGGSSGNQTLYIRSNAVYTGETTLGGVKYKITIGDAQFNGLLGDTLTAERRDDFVYCRGDMMMLATDDEKPDYYDSVYLSDYLMIGEDLYRVAVDFAETKLTLAAADITRAPMKIPTEVRRLEIAGSDGKTGAIAFLDPGSVVRIPAGSYQMMRYLLSRTEPAGDVWVLAASATARTLACTVDGSDAAEMAFGEPFSVQLTRQRLERMRLNEKDVYRLNMGAEGVAHEKVATVRHKSGDKTKFPLSTTNPGSPAEPTYKIVTTEGEKLAEGTFEYG